VPRWLDLLRRIESLPYDETIERIAETYLRHKLMPGPPSVDALHVALASYYNCDVLVTWDVRHIANPNKVRQLTRMNLALGLRTPRLATPEQLLAEG
jgi:predicted nucleic acid-binding protein